MSICHIVGNLMSRLICFIHLSCSLALFMDIAERDNHVHCVIPQRPIVKNFQIHHFLQNLFVACKETIKVTRDLSKLDNMGSMTNINGDVSLSFEQYKT